MTRSGKSPRLGAHSPEPMVDIHPDDASRTGITDFFIAELHDAREQPSVDLMVKFDWTANPVKSVHFDPIQK
jgi:hypothetical protein